MLKKRWLILIAGLVWFAAGVNIFRLGIQAYLSIEFSFWWILASLAILGLFGQGFYKMTKKNIKRIRSFEEEKKYFWHFFNLKSYIIMAFFITVGITLRASGWVPDWFIAFFYAGIGAALMFAGIVYVVNVIRYNKK